MENTFKACFGMRLNTERSYFVTSDLHFWHKNILKFCYETRPFSSVEDMNKGLVSQWNAVVKSGDVVFHLGDMSFAGMDRTKEILDQLNGTIVFILGNYDKVIRNQVKTQSKFDYFECRYKGVKICMSHYAMREWNQKGRGSVMLFGHSHGSLKVKGRSIDVGYDSMGRIMPLEEVLEQLLKIEDLDVGDHH